MEDCNRLHALDSCARGGSCSTLQRAVCESDLAEAKPTRAEHDGVPILLVRRGDRIFALAETCSHFNGPLSEGKLVGDSIVCPWHASRFALQDGRVLDGPAVHPQPCLRVRVQTGQVEIRKPLRDVAKPKPPA
jgi:nitrite reductase/ring-hydroxylating ferredoxin subunit